MSQPTTRRSDGRSAGRFLHLAPVIDPADDRVELPYRHVDIDGTTHDFTEVVRFPASGDWTAPGVTEAVRLLHLVAAVSYYKAFACPTIELGPHALSPSERRWLTEFYLDGLGEFSHVNGLDLSDLTLVADDAPEPELASARPGTARRPLMPFGGGLDSIVSLSLLPEDAEPSLFVVGRPGMAYAAIDKAASVTDLPMVRAERSLDPQVLRPTAETGFLNGHVPITGVISAIGIVAAALGGHDALVMSNEWSASSGTLEVDGVVVNHQYSKSWAFESAFADLVHRRVASDLHYFSILRPRTELWIAERFAELTEFHPVVHSCNRAFHADPARRLDHWCGECPKCAFIDLILSPVMSPDALGSIFAVAGEPLRRPEVAEEIRRLVGTSPLDKPFECVGDVAECRAALRLAAARTDRADDALLQALAAELGDPTPDEDPDHLRRALGPDLVPEAYRRAARLD